MHKPWAPTCRAATTRQSRHDRSRSPCRTVRSEPNGQLTRSDEPSHEHEPLRSRGYLGFATAIFAMQMGNAMARDNRSTSQRRTAIGSWRQASSRNARPDESWYWEYWFEREHSPDLPFQIARHLRNQFRRVIGGLRWPLTVEMAGAAGEARINRAWSAMDTDANSSARLLAADPDRNGDVEITLAGMVQRRSQIDGATAWDGTT